MLVTFMSLFDRMTSTMNENISEFWQFDSKSRELDGQKVGLDFGGFKASQ